MASTELRLRRVVDLVDPARAVSDIAGKSEVCCTLEHLR